jgi:hypothetical protein
MNYIDESMAPKLQSSDYSNGRFGYKIPDGYILDSIINNEIIIRQNNVKIITDYVGNNEK